MKKQIQVFFAIFTAAFVLTATATAQVAQGGSYTLNQAVVASGGGASLDTGGGLYSLTGTIGQTATGTSETTPYSVSGGFWTPTPFAPTAAGATLSGRVVTLEGAGIRNVIVMLTGGNLMTPRTTRTGSFGSFNFDNVPVGQVYIVSVVSKKYGFSQDSQVFSVLDNVGDIVFQASWEN